MRCASPAATARWAAQALDGLVYQPAWEALMVTTLGLGAAGDPAALPAAVARFVARGGNVFDAQQQAPALGASLAALFAAGRLQREQALVFAEGAADPTDAAALLAAGLCAPDDFVDAHCFAPAGVRYQVKRALSQLGLAALDLFWLGGADTLYLARGEAEFRQRLREACAALEVAAAQRELAAYGLSLQTLPFPPALALEIAQDVLGTRHHLRALRLPLAEAARLRAADLHPLTLVAAADHPPAAVPALATTVIVAAGAWAAASP